MEFFSTADSSVQGYPVLKHSTKPPSIVGEMMHCDVVFGSPKEDCRGTGICRIVTSYKNNGDQKKSCRNAPALLCSSDGGNSFILLFRQSDLCVHLMRHYFSQKKFLEIKHSCALPASAVSKMGLKSHLVPVGTHPISSGGGYCRIEFRLHLDWSRLLTFAKVCVMARGFVP